MIKIPRNKLHGLGQAARVQLSGPQAYPLHDHTFGEIFWVDKGACDHVANGRTFSLTKGHLVFMRPSDQHSFHGRTRQAFFINNVCFQWHIYAYLKQRYFRNTSSIYGEDKKYPQMILLTERQIQYARHFFLTLYRSPKALLHIEQYLLNIFIEFSLPRNQIVQNVPDLPSWMEKAWVQIQQPEHFRLGVAEFCRLSGRCREHVSRVFRQAVGITIHQHMNQLRMKHAAFLLEGSSQEIIEIAQECGFESLSHFYLSFRKVHGMTPLAFRRRAQGRMYAT